MSLSLTTTSTPLLAANLMPPNHSTALVAIIFCTSIVSTALGIISSTMLSSMIADVVEAAELKTGRRSEGLFFAASTFVGKAVSGFGILGASLIVEFIHLQSGANPDSVPPAVVRNLALVYCPVMIGLYAVVNNCRTGRKTPPAPPIWRPCAQFQDRRRCGVGGGGDALIDL